ncbi:MAG TPA: acyl transferase [Flavobacteriales bacterium]|jgi:phenylacetate-coenzyme A ligase PaaK-like adenylate-forming protein|nr:acyl transferase [Flavobacteriales bacterium]
MSSDFSIFDIQNAQAFNQKAIETFRYQAKQNPVYKEFLSHLKVNPDDIQEVAHIPFMPIEFFKTHSVTNCQPPFDAVFMSSGTTGMQRSQHYIKDLKTYEESFTKGFELFYGPIKNFTIIALLPSYVEQGHSSLVYMVDKLIKKTGKTDSGFYLNDEHLPQRLTKLDNKGEPILLIGVSYALLDLVEQHHFTLNNTIVMETGGMKGRRKEMLREELHEHLTKGFGVSEIHSEYGMTELLSQSYSKGQGIFKTPPWQKVLIRDTEDPFTYLPDGKSGGINIIDLANIHSCSFIATQDLGKIVNNNQFEILGRFDHSDIRGCNLLIM